MCYSCVNNLPPAPHPPPAPLFGVWKKDWFEFHFNNSGWYLRHQGLIKLINLVFHQCFRNLPSPVCLTSSYHNLARPL